MFCAQGGLKNSCRPKCRVELHIHLDGAIRPETIWEIMRKKNMTLPGSGSLEALKEALEIKEAGNLHQFLQPFSIFIPAFSGDLEAIERISFEFAEDQSGQGILYTEARFCPHIFLPQPNPAHNELEKSKVVSVRDILECALRGLKKGEDTFKVKIRLILCCIRGKNDWSWEILELCKEYRDRGVVGIDIAGNKDSSSTSEAENVDEVHIFEEAKRLGIRRSIHAGEDGDWTCVQQAVDELGAERIGHGYRALENEEFYLRCLKERIHLEVCPYSSYLTGAVQKLTSKRHPVLRFAEDGASFSINSDDPTITGTRLDQEYDLLRKWGFNEALFVKCNFEAAVNSFLPAEEKRELLLQMKESYGIPSDECLNSSAILSLHEATSEEHIVDGKTAAAVVNISSWEDRNPNE